MTPNEAIAAVLAAQTTAIVLLAVALVRTREKLTRLEEWARLIEKRVNGTAAEHR